MSENERKVKWKHGDCSTIENFSIAIVDTCWFLYCWLFRFGFLCVCVLVLLWGHITTSGGFASVKYSALKTINTSGSTCTFAHLHTTLIFRWLDMRNNKCGFAEVLCHLFACCCICVGYFFSLTCSFGFSIAFTPSVFLVLLSTYYRFAFFVLSDTDCHLFFRIFMSTLHWNKFLLGVFGALQLGFGDSVSLPTFFGLSDFLFQHFTLFHIRTLLNRLSFDHMEYVLHMLRVLLNATHLWILTVLYTNGNFARISGFCGLHRPEHHWNTSPMEPATFHRTYAIHTSDQVRKIERER